jgi:glyoxylase-like metal-dependent hydrolase (beta-lactamase superfamily II)
VVVVEGFYRPAGAAWLAQQARALTGRWPTHAVITHYHVDHASGVTGYAHDEGTPRLHMTDATRTMALAGGPVAPLRDATLDRAFADVVLVSAETDAHIDLGNRTLVLRPYTGHTRSDLTVLDVDAGLFWAGDLVWYRMFPNFVDATPSPLARSGRALAALLSSSSARLVPGHGAHIDRNGMNVYLALLDSLEAAARAGHAAGTPAGQVAAAYSVPASLGEWMASATSLERAVRAWYRELG